MQPTDTVRRRKKAQADKKISEGSIVLFEGKEFVVMTIQKNGLLLLKGRRRGPVSPVMVENTGRLGECVKLPPNYRPIKERSINRLDEISLKTVIWVIIKGRNTPCIPKGETLNSLERKRVAELTANHKAAMDCLRKNFKKARKI